MMNHHALGRATRCKLGRDRTRIFQVSRLVERNERPIGDRSAFASGSSEPKGDALSRVKNNNVYIYIYERERERERECVCVCVYAYVYAHILYRERIATLDSVSNGALGMTSLHFATLVAAPTSLRQPKVQGSRLHADSRGESSAKFSSRYQARQARGRSSLATRCNGLMMRARHAAESSGIATGAGQRAKGNS